MNWALVIPMDRLPLAVGGRQFVGHYLVFESNPIGRAEDIDNDVVWPRIWMRISSAMVMRLYPSNMTAYWLTLWT
jgi:hypothetical protein